MEEEASFSVFNEPWTRHTRRRRKKERRELRETDNGEPVKKEDRAGERRWREKQTHSHLFAKKPIWQHFNRSKQIRAYWFSFTMVISSDFPFGK